jgi:hypothetical protein
VSVARDWRQFDARPPSSVNWTELTSAVFSSETAAEISFDSTQERDPSPPRADAEYTQANADKLAKENQYADTNQQLQSADLDGSVIQADLMPLILDWVELYGVDTISETSVLQLGMFSV